MLLKTLGKISFVKAVLKLSKFLFLCMDVLVSSINETHQKWRANTFFFQISNSFQKKKKNVFPMLLTLRFLDHASYLLHKGKIRFSLLKFGNWDSTKLRLFLEWC